MSVYNQPPIPPPDGSAPPPPPPSTMPYAGMPAPYAAPAINAGDWHSAPKIVKNWAYQLTTLGIIFLPFIILAMLFVPQKNSTDGIGAVIFYGVLFVVAIWLNRAIKKGRRAAWTVQIVISVLGLLGFPLGTLIHGYILSKWFNDDTKAWFGVGSRASRDHYAIRI